MRGIEVVPFIGARVELVHFANLPGQAFAIALQQVLCLQGLVVSGLRRTPALPQSAQGIGGNARVVVQQGAHRVGPGEALPGVLAMDIEHLFAYMAQLLRGSGQAVDPSPAFAGAVQTAAQQQAVRTLKTGFGQPGQQRCWGIKLGADVGARGAFADQSHIGAGAGGQLQGINQDGLARAGLAGEHGKTGLQFQVQRGNDDKVAQRNTFEAHRLTPPLVPVQLVAQRVKVRPALGMQKAHAVL